jgi:hypothetical protein
MSSKQINDLRSYIAELRSAGRKEEARLLETLL